MARWQLSFATVCLALLSMVVISRAQHPANEPSDSNNILQATMRHQYSAVPHLKTKPTPAPVADDEDPDDLQGLLDDLTTVDYAVGSHFGNGSSDGDEASTASVSAWSPVTLTPDNARIALDAVRYRNNYEKYITTRLCLHRINLIRSRLVDDLTSFLFSVDGCEGTKITPTGRCDIYYCKLATYELKVTQKTANKDLFIVQSIFKALTQKTISELMAPSNLNFNERNDDDGTGGGGNTRERALAQAESLAKADEFKLLLRLPLTQQKLMNHGAEVVVGLVAACAVVVALVVVKLARQQQTAMRERRARARRRRQSWLHPLRATSSSSLLSEHSGLLVPSASHQSNNKNLEAV